MLHSIEKKSAIREFQSDIIEYRMTVLAHDFPDYHKELVNENRKDLINRFDVHGEELYCVEDEANDAFDALVKALTGDEDGEYERLEEFRKFWPTSMEYPTTGGLVSTSRRVFAEMSVGTINL